MAPDAGLSPQAARSVQEIETRCRQEQHPCPATLKPEHWAELVGGSGIAPDLAEANVATITGPDVLEVLVGDRLVQLGGHALQYVTARAARITRPIEAIAAAGGWWCSGLDPQTDWRPMDWGCFKPDQPRWDQERNRHRKYEHPLGISARLLVLRVPASIARKIAKRYRLVLPLEVAADATGDGGAFWRWWAKTPALPLLITEGAKKAACLLSHGEVAVALPGIWNGATKDALGRRQLHPDLAALPLQGRSCMVLFDHSSSDRGRRNVARAARRQGWLLQQAGAATVLVGTCPGPHKGADDALVAGVPVDQLLANLATLQPLPVLPRLRRADVVVPAGKYMGEAIAIPATAKLVALEAAMGAGKSELIAAHLAPLMAAGVRVVLITHRTSLGAALAQRLDLPWADEAAPGSDLRQRGVACCIDSLCPSSAMRITPADWRGAVVVMDEVAAVLAHALMGTATAVAQRRVPVLTTLRQLLADAAQVLVADAQLNDPVLQALEAATGERAWLISSEHQPAAGRSLQVLPSRDAWRGVLLDHLARRRRVWIATTAKDGPNGAKALNEAITEHWADARVLRIDSDTVADPTHDASRIAADPDAIAADYDVVVATPAVAAGLSVAVQGHFDAVLVIAGGTTDANAVAQAAARVRDNCPRFLFAPPRSPGHQLRVGCGACDPDVLLANVRDHAALVGQLLAAGGCSVTTPTTGPWLPLWAQLAATINATRHAYGATVVGLLQREGYSVITPADADAGDLETAGEQLGDQLQEIAAQAQADADAQVQAAELITDRQARDLINRRRRLTPAETAQLQRWRIARAWGLGTTAPSPAVIEAHRDGIHRRLHFRWTLTTAEGRTAAAQQDLQAAQEHTPTTGTWLPDLTANQHGPRLQVADALGLPTWLERTDWFTADDHQLAELHHRMTTHARATTQTLGIAAATAGGRSQLVGKLRTTTLRRLLALVGYRLEAQRTQINGTRAWRYRVTPIDLPDGIDLAEMQRHWAGDAAQDSPLKKGADVAATVMEAA